jgi:hypothetical protein
MKYQSPGRYNSKVIGKVKVSDRMTEWQNDRQDKNNMPPIFFMGGIKIQNTVIFKDFSKINGFNSGKNYSITSKHEL